MLKKIISDLEAVLESLRALDIDAVEPKSFIPGPSGLLDLIQTDAWPLAVPPDQICDPNDEAQKNERAANIISGFIGQSLKGKKFLDFGCGDGHVARTAAAEASLAVGYDPASQEVVDGVCTLTADFKKVKESAPYDVIMIYDVLDHCIAPIEVLNQARSVAGKDARIYVCCHPWCSRHGSHFYQKFNKAFAHLFLTEDELKGLGCELTEPNQKVLFPLRTYKEWFQKAKLRVDSDNAVRKPVEEFFSENPAMLKILQSMGYTEGFPTYQLEQCFIEFVLKK